MHRVALAHRCRVRKTSVCSIVEELRGDGLVVPDDPCRPRSPVRLSPEGPAAIAAALDPDAVHVARVQLDGSLRSPRTVPLPRPATPETVLELLGECLRPLLAGAGGALLGAGLAMPGLVDPGTGVCLQAANLPGWRDVPVGARLESALGVPVFVDNDVRCHLWDAAWCDRRLAEGDSLAYVEVAAGVGGALVLDGRPVLGAGCAAGEFGHVPVPDNARACRCGRVGCVETLCSLPALLAEIAPLRPNLPPFGTAEDLGRAAAEEPVVMNVLDRSMRILGRALAGALAFVAPRALLFGTPSLALSRALQPLLARQLARDLGEARGARLSILPVVADGRTLLRGVGGRVIADWMDRGELAYLKATTLTQEGGIG